MSLWSRITNVFGADRLDREIDEELQSHIDEAVEQGRDPEEARRAFGSKLRAREYSRDAKLAVWLESLGADTIFGIRQLFKNKVSSAAAILSLALAIGACTSAFRLIDAVLLRPLPVANPESLYFVTYEVVDWRTGKTDTSDAFEYPLFREMRAAVKDQAGLLAINYAGRGSLTYASDNDMERMQFQYVSGEMFGSFGLKPAHGRLLTPNDDIKPGAHPYAVLSYDYWTRRFARDPKAVGRTFTMGKDLYEIVGVAPDGFTGTDTGTLTDIFVPTMMNAKAINNRNWSWLRAWAQIKPGVSVEQVRQKLQATFYASRRENTKSWNADTPKDRLDAYLRAPVFLEPASAGVSGMQKNYRRSLVILGILVILVLLIACANVANLMTARAAARAREMALRISIGAGRRRLIQLVLMESALLAGIASLLGG
ncbi:MAG TPA: ABC transporter permease, partial [Bryobacteraceae bacterium]|nr:ABC transporter permease [Bryobacteraceae bacterium]